MNQILAGRIGIPQQAMTQEEIDKDLYVDPINIGGAEDRFEPEFSTLFQMVHKQGLALDEYKKLVFNEMLKLKKTLTEQMNELPLEIIGEPYLRFDSNARYYPTLMFVFKELGVEKLAKRTQIRIRWMKNLNVTSEERVALQKSLEQFHSDENTLKYYTGPVRANYVSASEWKTTIYVQQAYDAYSVIESILNITGEEFERERFSFTEGRKLTKFGNLTPNLTPRYEPEWHRYSEMNLYKVFLIVTGERHPMILFQQDCRETVADLKEEEIVRDDN